MNDIYSGMKAPNNKPTKTTTSEIINATFLPSLSEIKPKKYDPSSNAHIVNVAVKKT